MEKMTKEELIKEVELQQQIILDLQIQLENSRNSSGRKSQVLELLKEHGAISVLDIAKKLNISTKNVSSQLTYLRTDGYKVFTDNHGKKVLM
jgi:biotin operon repressor